VRYKLPEGSTSQLIDFALLRNAIKPLEAASGEFRFATAVAGFGQILRGGKYTGNWRYSDARQLGMKNAGQDKFGYRGEFLRLVDLAAALGTKANK
jgi:Ca-activated chloride channel family protein